MGGLGTLLERLQGLFGKGFLVAGFLPALVFFAANLLLALLTIPATVQVLALYLRLEVEEQALLALALVFALAVLGFLLWVASAWLHQLLQGHALPEFAQAALRWLRRQRLNRLEAELQAAGNDAYDYRRVHEPGADSWQEQLKAALLVSPPSPPPKAPELEELGKTELEELGKTELEELGKTELEELRKQVRMTELAGEAIPFSRANSLFQQVRLALQGAPPPVAVEPASLLLTEFVKLAELLKQRAEAREAVLRQQRDTEFPLRESDLQPTRMANTWRVDMDYAWRRYGMGSELFELHLQQLVASNEQAAAFLGERQIKLAFAISLTALSGLLTLCWLPLLTRWLDLLMFSFATGALLIMPWIFYQITRLASQSYGAALRSMIDLYRFELLRALHLELPENSQAEQDLWRRLTAHSELVLGNPITYQHKEASVVSSPKPAAPPPSGLDPDS